MKTKILYLSVAFALFLFGGCGIAERTTNESPGSPSSNTALAASVSIDKKSVSDQLYSAHSEWEGTPYVLGGSGINGVDCSSFTQIVFRDYFGTQLPRNTREQLQEGESVRRQHISEGDLIFFRTDRNTLHVGIAMGNGDFLHASVSQGVMISNLSEPYWAGKSIGSRRVID